MLLEVPSTEAALPCCSTMDTLHGEGMRGTGDPLLMPVSKLRAKGTFDLTLNCNCMGQNGIFIPLSGFSSCGYSSSSPCGTDMYEAAKMSTQVKSQTRHWPDFHGAMETTIRSLTVPSDLHRPMGSSVDGTFTCTAASNLCMNDGIDSSMP